MGKLRSEDCLAGCELTRTNLTRGLSFISFPLNKLTMHPPSYVKSTNSRQASNAMIGIISKRNRPLLY
jgi:hypothetical protein